MAQVRTFIAFDAPDAVRAEMAALTAELRAGGGDVRWEQSDKYHVTIKFLGPVEESALMRVLRDVDRVVKPFRPFDVVFRTLGCFPDRRRPRVVWIGCDNADGALLQIKNALDEALLPQGFEVEKRSFHPHITLGRVKSPEGSQHLTTMLEKRTFEPRIGRIETINVMKSVLRPTGAEYSVLSAIHLQQ